MEHVKIVKAPKTNHRTKGIGRSRAEAMKAMKVGDAILVPGPRQYAANLAHSGGIFLDRTFRTQPNGKEGNYIVRDA